MSLKLLAAAAMLVVGAAHATILTTYTSQAAYDAATYNNTVINFDDIAPPMNPGYAILTPPTLTDGGATFFVDTSVSNSYLYELPAQQYAPATGDTGIVLSAESSQNGGSNNLTIDLPTPSTAFSLTFSSFTVIDIPREHFVPDPLLLTFSDGTTLAFTPAVDSDFSFLGFASSDPISSVVLSDDPVTAPSSGINFAQLEAGSTQPTSSVTPEPSSFALLGTGLLGVTGLLRKRLV